ncbi:hypothetical protein ACFL59_14400 [Planctomycetota bacterium]
MNNPVRAYHHRQMRLAAIGFAIIMIIILYGGITLKMPCAEAQTGDPYPAEVMEGESLLKLILYAGPGGVLLVAMIAGVFATGVGALRHALTGGRTRAEALIERLRGLGTATLLFGLLLSGALMLRAFGYAANAYVPEPAVLASGIQGVLISLVLGALGASLALLMEGVIGFVPQPDRGQGRTALDRD